MNARTAQALMLACVVFGALPIIAKQGGGPTAAVNGTVVDDLRQPVRRAIVTLEGGKSQSAISDDDGRFDLASVPPGNYHLYANRPGYALAWFGSTVLSPNGIEIEIAAGERQRVELSMSRIGTITGLVTDESGEPTDAFLEAEPTGGPEGWTGSVWPQSTDARGRFRFSNVPPGDYLIKVSFRPFVWASSEQTGLVGRPARYWPGVADRRAAQSISVHPGEHVDGIDFRYVLPQPASTIRVSVVSSDGVPTQARLAIVQPSDADRNGVSIRNGYQATQTIGPVFEGTYVIAGASIHQRGSTEVFRPEFGVINVTGGGQGTVEAVMRLQPGGSIVGQVLFEGPPPPASSRVSFTVDRESGGPAWPEGWAPVSVTDAGRLSIVGLQPGGYRVRPYGSGWFVASVSVSGVEQTGPIVIRGAETISNVVVTLRPSSMLGRITGRLEHADGRADFSHAVVLLPGDPKQRVGCYWIQVAQPTTKGSFRFEVPPGQYRVSASSPAFNCADPRQVEATASVGELIVVEPGGTVSLRVKSE